MSIAPQITGKNIALMKPAKEAIIIPLERVGLDAEIVR
jgi:hypothetical protein